MIAHLTTLATTWRIASCGSIRGRIKPSMHKETAQIAWLSESNNWGFIENIFDRGVQAEITPRCLNSFEWGGGEFGIIGNCKGDAFVFHPAAVEEQTVSVDWLNLSQILVNEFKGVTPV